MAKKKIEPMIKKQLTDTSELLRDYLTFDYLSRHGHSITDIAYPLHVNERRLVEWISRHSAAMTRLMTVHQIAVDKMRAEIEEEYAVKDVVQEGWNPDPTKDASLVRKIAHMMMEKKPFGDIAKACGCGEDEFRVWWDRNKALINKQYFKS